MSSNSVDTMSPTEVVIVGLGPTGATLANILGGYGINVLVLEREESIYPLPRAVHFDDEAMRVFQSVGLAGQIDPKVRVNCGTRFVDKNQDLLLDWPRSQDIGPLGWYPSYRFHQPDLEADLNDGLARQDSVTVLRECTVTDIVQDDDGATISWEQNGKPSQVRADFVVGADGARSVVRHSFDCDWEDLGFKERWLVVDVQLTADRSDLGDFTIQTCDRARPTTYVRCPREWRRWEISLHDHERDEDVVSDDFIWPHMRPSITPDEGRIVRRAVYNFESKLSDKWRDRRCFIAGDAAHLMPPFLGQGMCAGVRDVANLGWKLAAVLRWNAPDALLDTYERERRPHTRVYIETAVNVGQMMNNAETAETLTHAINPDGSAQMKSISRGLAHAMGPADGHLAGARMPQPVLADGRRLSDAMAGRFAVIAGRDALADHADHLPDDASIIILDADAHEALADLLEIQGVSALAIRPDFYCYGGVQGGDAAAIVPFFSDLRAQISSTA